MDIFTALTFETWSVLAQSLIFGVALVVAVRVALEILAPANASTRFAIWFATLIAIAVLPLAFFVRTAVPTLLQRAAVKQSLVTTVQTLASTHTMVAAPPVTGLPVTPQANSIAVPAASQPFQTQLLMPAEFAFGVLPMYAFVVLVLFGRLGFSYLRLQRLKAGTSPAPPEVLKRLERCLSMCEISRPVQLLLSTKAGSPMAVGFSRPAVIIPDSLLLQLTGEEFDHLGLHELAHIRRYDDWTNLLQRVIQAVFFFHPAVHWICRKLDFEREVACDDWVLSLTGAAKPYARSLAKVLECMPWRRGPILASGAVFRKHQIIRRIEMLLDGTRDSKPRISTVTFVVILMCLFGAFSQIVQVPSLIAFGIDHGGSRYRSRWHVDGRTFDTEIRGDVQFGDDDVSVQTLSPGGYVRLRENGWTRRELDIRLGNSGRPDVRYLVDGRERPLDDRGREWIATILPAMIRESGINAEERATRILEKRGAAGVLEEIDRISSDHSRRKYLSAVILSGKLNTDDLRRAMSRAGRISSDHDKSNLLLEVASLYNSDQLRGAYFDAVNTISSDHDRRRVLTHVIEDSRSDATMLAQAGRSVERMSSDHDKAELLKLSAPSIAASDPEVRRSLLRAAGSISSDHDKARVISSILGGGQLPPEVLEDVLRVASKIQSDHDKSKVLELAVQQELKHPSTQAAFFSAVGTIGSDNDRTRVLNAIIQRGFSGEIAATLAFINAVRSINSDNDKRHVLEAMLERGNSADVVKTAVELAATIGSDNDKAHVLSMIAEKHGDNPEVRDAVRKAAEKIGSDSDYRRIVSKLQRRE